MSNRKRIVIAVGASLLLAFAYVCLFGIQNAFALFAWNTGRKIPKVNEIPKEIADSSINRSQGTKFSKYGYEFEVPWTDVDEAKSKMGINSCLLSFNSGIRMTFTVEPARAFVENFASKSGGEELLRRRFGDEAISSDYNFYRLMLTTTPANVHAFSSREDATKTWVMLTLKAIAMLDPGHSGTYFFRTANFQGFQFGTPGNASKVVINDLLDDEGNAEFVFVDVQGQPTRIIQADINRTIQSLKRLPAVAVKSSHNANVASVR
jgi:hypothetical protein